MAVKKKKVQKFDLIGNFLKFKIKYRTKDEKKKKQSYEHIFNRCGKQLNTAGGEKNLRNPLEK